MTVLLSVLFAVVGLIIYLASVNPKAAEAGRLMFGTGILAFLLQSDKVVALFR